MEAIYDDGSFAGPQNWTSFKEFAYTFSPLYNQNEIILKETFFNEVEDNKEVNLTFHFWSGEVLSYTIVKNGNDVDSVHEEDTTTPLDLTELTDLIRKAEAVENKESIYTEKTFNALQEAIKNAKSALNTLDSEEDLKAEIVALQKAIAELKIIEKPIIKEETVISKPVITKGKATISSDDIEKLAQKGQLTIQMTAVDDIEEILLTAEQVSELIGKNANIVVEKSGVIITIPTTYFNEGDLTIKVRKLSPLNITIPKELKVIGDIFDITIIQDGKVINEFTSGDPITLSFPVDQNIVKNLDQLSVFYFDPETNEWIAIGGEYAEGFVTVTTDHLSIFVLMEILETQVVDDEKSTSETDITKDPSNQDGEVLPNTATSTYTMLLAGAVLLIMGATSLLLFKKRRLQQ